MVLDVVLVDVAGCVAVDGPAGVTGVVTAVPVG